MTVFAAHGMGPVYHASWNLPEILDLLGYGREQLGKKGQAAAARRSRNLWRILKMTIPSAWQYRIKGALPQAIQEQLVFRWYSGVPFPTTTRLERFA